MYTHMHTHTHTHIYIHTYIVVFVKTSRTHTANRHEVFQNFLNQKCDFTTT